MVEAGVMRLVGKVPDEICVFAPCRDSKTVARVKFSVIRLAQQVPGSGTDRRVAGDSEGRGDVTAPRLRAVFLWKKYQATACGFRKKGGLP